jgi:restriction system protein
MLGKNNNKGVVMAVPTYDNLFNPLLKAFHNLGGSASISEQEIEVAKLLNLTEKDIAEIHRGNRTVLSYRLAWARNYLKRFNIIESSKRGVWALTNVGLKTEILDKNEVNKSVKALDKVEIKKKQVSGELFEDEAPDIWEDELLSLLKKIDPGAFERLCQRLLRESGFIQVEVTGRSNDGGVDGKGVLRLGGLLSFHVLFQAKRYQKTVSPSIVRDFRGALVGRADKGLIITTGSFSREAKLEAQRAGATPIDLIDGEELVEKLKALSIGVEVKEKIVEEVIINHDYFQKL